MRTGPWQAWNLRQQTYLSESIGFAYLRSREPTKKHSSIFFFLPRLLKTIYHCFGKGCVLSTKWFSWQKVLFFFFQSGKHCDVTVYGRHARRYLSFRCFLKYLDIYNSQNLATATAWLQSSNQSIRLTFGADITAFMNVSLIPVLRSCDQKLRLQLASAALQRRVPERSHLCQQGPKARAVGGGSSVSSRVTKV